MTTAFREGMNSFEISKLTGIPLRTLQSWHQKKILLFSNEPGTGKKILWKRKHIREIRILRQFRDQGISMQLMKKAMDYMRDILGHNPLSSGHFIIVFDKNKKPTNLIKIDTEGKAIETINKYQGQYLLSFIDNKNEQ